MENEVIGRYFKGKESEVYYHFNKETNGGNTAYTVIDLSDKEPVVMAVNEKIGVDFPKLDEIPYKAYKRAEILSQGKIPIDVIPKAWGREEVVVNNDLYCGKFLYLKYLYKSSLHYHKVKDETFHVLAGQLSFVKDGRMYNLKKGDTVRIKPGEKHRFSGTSQTGAVIIEFSTSHSDDDVVRIEKSGEINFYDNGG